MILLVNTMLALAKLVDMVFGAFFFLVLARGILSWVNPDPYNPIVRFLVMSTEPLLQPIRRFVKPINGIDFSPLILIIIIQVLQSFLVGTLSDYARAIAAGA